MLCAFIWAGVGRWLAFALAGGSGYGRTQAGSRESIRPERVGVASCGERAVVSRAC